MRKTKAKLIMTLSVAMLSVFTMGVSTFAWFQAQAEVNIRTNSTSTNITVSKPDDFIFYAYKGNTLASWDNPGTFDNDFIQVTSSNLAEQTSFNGTSANKFNPGDVKAFALYYSDHTANNPINLEITDLTSQTIKKVNNSYSRLISTTSVEVNIGWAINMYSISITSLSNHKPAYSSYSTFVTSLTGNNGSNDGTDKITLAYNSNVIGKKGNNDISIINETNNARYCKLDEDASIDLYNSASEAASEGYIFYSIVFNDDASIRCKEVDSSGNDLYIKPAEGSRYFVRNTSSNQSAIWNSNCYSDLTFAIHAMNFTF